MSEQYHFDFKDWKDAFEMFYRKKQGYKVLLDGRCLGKVKGNPRICLAISTASYTSGYWIEENAKSGKDAKVYRSVKAVKALEQRIEKEVSESESFALGKLVV